MDTPSKHRKARHMRREWIPLFLGVALVALMTGACGSAPAVAANKPAVTVEVIEGSDVKRIVLSESAAARLGVETAPVGQTQVDGTDRRIVPYAALIYDAKGGSWVYVNTFVRHSVVVDRITGDQALLREGPDAGAIVATVGVPELWGVETGVGGGH
jgi:hypothetical protein